MPLEDIHLGRQTQNVRLKQNKMRVYLQTYLNLSQISAGPTRYTVLVIT